MPSGPKSVDSSCLNQQSHASKTYGGKQNPLHNKCVVLQVAVSANKQTNKGWMGPGLGIGCVSGGGG